jgi:hypothetical protein
MKDMGAVRFNEKVKRLSTLVGGGGLAFILTALTRSIEARVDLLGGLWIFAGIGLIFASVQMNDLLDSEEQE